MLTHWGREFASFSAIPGEAAKTRILHLNNTFRAANSSLFIRETNGTEVTRSLPATLCPRVPGTDGISRGTDEYPPKLQHYVKLSYEALRLHSSTEG